MASGSMLFQRYINGDTAAPTSVTGVQNPATYNANFSSLYPNLGVTQEQVSGNTLARLRGELSPETLNTIQDTAARFGISSGMPLGGGGNSITGNFGRKLVGQSVEGLQSQGLQDYLNTLKSYSGTLMPTTGEAIGADTSRYGIDVGAATASARLGQEAYQFGLTFPEGQRQFDASLGENARQSDVGNYLQNNQANDRLALGYAGLGQNYLNSYLQFLQ